MTFVSAVLTAPTQSGLIKALVSVVPAGAMDLKRDWDTGSPIFWIDTGSSDALDDLQTLERLWIWTRNNGIGMTLYETMSPDEHLGDIVDMDYVRNVVTRNVDIRNEDRSEDGLIA